MAQVNHTSVLEVTAARVWETISSFHGIERWLPAIRTSEVVGVGVGARRTCTLHDGAQLHERLEEVDALARRLRYAMVEAPLPIRGYSATMAVRELGPERCELAWIGDFEVSADQEPAMVELFRGAYAAGADGLAALCK